VGAPVMPASCGLPDAYYSVKPVALPTDRIAKRGLVK
jgi:hypothetical protein